MVSLSLRIATILLQLAFVYSYSINTYTSSSYSTYNVQKFIYGNKVSPFVLFTIVNNCCKCIMLYHDSNKKYHGNTTLSNFCMNENYECLLLDTGKDNSKQKLNQQKQLYDYSIFFNSCVKELYHKNNYFIGMLNRHKISVFETLILFRDKV